MVVETEAELLTQQGIVGSGTQDPLVKEWTVQFTSQYRELRRQRPIYAELEGLFRFIVLARALKLRDAFTAAALSSDGLLEDAPIAAVPVPRNYNGCYNVRRHDETQTISGGERHVSLVMPSCGGVQMDRPVTEANFTRDQRKRLHPLRARVLEARGDAQKLYWDF